MGLAFSACLLGTRAANTLGNHGNTAAELRARFRPVQMRPAPSLGVTSAHPPESPRMRAPHVPGLGGAGVRTTHGSASLGLCQAQRGKRYKSEFVMEQAQKREPEPVGRAGG